MRSQELNLLQIFDVIMLERSVTRAASRLAISQPAVSNAISRMRDRWRDPLFIKSGRSIEPTAFAHSLWRQIRKPLAELESAIDLKQFNPATSQRQFRIALSDFAVELLWLPLLKKLESEAPEVAIYASPFSVQGSPRQLREGQVDFSIGPASPDLSVRSLYLFDDSLVLVARKEHVMMRSDRVSMEDFLKAKHLLVSSDHQATGIVDEHLRNQQLSRKVSVTVNHFSAVPQILMNTDYIAAIPRVIAGAPGFKHNLAIRPHPLAMEAMPVYLNWHVRSDGDIGFQWFKNLLVEILTERFNYCHQGTSYANNASTVPLNLSA